MRLLFAAVAEFLAEEVMGMEPNSGTERTLDAAVIVAVQSTVDLIWSGVEQCGGAR